MATTQLATLARAGPGAVRAPTLLLSNAVANAHLVDASPRRWRGTLSTGTDILYSFPKSLHFFSLPLPNPA